VVLEEMLTLLHQMEQVLVVVLEVQMDLREKMLEEAEVPSVVVEEVLVMLVTLMVDKVDQVVAVL
jgi:hypothetical protein